MGRPMRPETKRFSPQGMLSGWIHYFSLFLGSGWRMGVYAYGMVGLRAWRRRSAQEATRNKAKQNKTPTGKGNRQLQIKTKQRKLCGVYIQLICGVHVAIFILFIVHYHFRPIEVCRR